MIFKYIVLDLNNELKEIIVEEKYNPEEIEYMLKALEIPYKTLDEMPVDE